MRRRLVKAARFLWAGNAARWLYYLNHYARRNRGVRYAIYALKTAFIEQMLPHSQTQIDFVEQIIGDCYECGGYGFVDDPDYRYYGETCWKCGGTGKYSVILAEITMVIGTQRYCWHQPLNRVRHLVRISTAWDSCNYRLYEPMDKHVNVTTGQAKVLYRALRTWLVLHGARQLPLFEEPL
jgi:hypothetical protein